MADLFFIYGAMGSGKTTELLMKAFDYESEGKKVLLIKPSKDDKGEDKVVNRMGMERKVDYLVKPEESILSVVTSLNVLPDVIIAEEAQFFTEKQVDELFLISKDFDIEVFAYGIRSDFKQNAFTGSARLFTIADNIVELDKKICNCGAKATNNLRLFKGIPVFDGESILIDKASDPSKTEETDYSYKSVCGNCYLRIRRKYSGYKKH